MRSIRAALAASALEAKTNSIAIVGPQSGVGASYLAANLAVAFAQAAAPTLLVDANLRNPRIAQMFGVDRRAEGLADALNYRMVSCAADRSRRLAGLVDFAGLARAAESAGTAELAGVRQSRRRIASPPWRRNLRHDGRGRMRRRPDRCHTIAAAVIVARRHKTAVTDTTKLAAQLCGAASARFWVRFWMGRARL